jgi:hypothetical protein
MSARAGIFAAAIIAATTVVTTLCANSSRPTIRVMLRNDVNAPPQTIEAAQEAVSAVYEAAGLDVVWAGGQPIATLALISRNRAARLRVRPDVIGFAINGRGRRGKMAYIFEHRVNELAARYRFDPSVVLGAVMAHELGHLLLPVVGHSDTGVMQPLFDGADFRQAHRGELLFTADQVAQIRLVTSHASF